MTSPSKVKKLGRQTPTRYVYDETLQSLWDDPVIQRRAQQWGFDFMPWQENIIRNCLAIDEEGNLAYRNVGFTVPRQNGKSEIIIFLILLFLILFGEEILYSSYEDGSAAKIYKRLMKHILGNGKLRPYFPWITEDYILLDQYRVMVLRAYKPGKKQSIGSCEFRTRAGKGGRGGTFSKVFFDEAQRLKAEFNDNLAPTVTSFPEGQVYYIGTAPELIGKEVADDSNFFKGYRTKAIDGKIEHACWMEWSVDTLLAADDKAMWYQANPALGYTYGKNQGITLASLETSRGSAASEVSFAVEYLGYIPEFSANPAIDLGRWKLRKTKRLVQNIANANSKLAVAVKISKTEDTAQLAVAVMTEGHPIFLELKQTWSTNKELWYREVGDTLAAYIKSGSCTSVFLDGDDERVRSILIHMADQHGSWNKRSRSSRQGKITIANSTDVVAACSVFLQSISDGTMEHYNQPIVEAAVEDAVKRDIKNSSGGFGFRSSTGRVDVTCLETMAFALYGLKLTRPTEKVESEEYEELASTSSIKRGRRSSGLGSLSKT